jgi:uncharacterized protein YbjQ (UPF0145 family)
MLISTMNDVPGYKVTSVLGEVFGLTVRSRNVGSNRPPGDRSLLPGSVGGSWSCPCDTSEMGGNWTEICAYGTAVVIEPLG